MTTTLTAQPRRQSAAQLRPPRDLPVLFHLLDVSRPRGYSAKPAETSPGTYALHPDHGSLPAESCDQKTTEELNESCDLSASIALAAQSPATDEVVQSAPEAADTQASAPEPDALADDAKSPSQAEMPPATSDQVALRERAEERQRKRQAAARDDWFALHGKYIAIGFVIALLATIYAARSQRKPAPPEVAKPLQVHKHKPQASPAGTASVKQSTPDQSAARPAVAITGVGSISKGAGESQTALHPPTIPQLAAQPEPSPASDGLFPWAKREEERLASRTGEVASPSAATAAASAEAPTAPPPTAEQHSYPSTPYPGDYRQLSAPAAASQQPAASSQPFYPTTNSPSGYRHERSGSGFH